MQSILKKNASLRPQQPNSLGLELVIFDLDGTLVDSETLCNQAFLDLLPELNMPVASLVQQFRGRKLSLILAELSEHLGRPLPINFESTYRHRVAELFSTQLKAMPNVHEMLASLPYEKCVASSGPVDKISHALAVSGLAPFFGKNVFSSYTLNSWKPDPGLFLHAALTMGFHPSRCVVVDDSEVGLQAAAAAGMRALHFVPHRANEMQLADSSFKAMAQFPHLLERMAVVA